MILTPDWLSLVCAGFDYDPEAIGKHMLETLAKFQTEGYYSRPFHRHG